MAIVRSWTNDGKVFGLTAADAEYPMLPEGAYFRNFPIMMQALAADMARVATGRDAVAEDRATVQGLASTVATQHGQVQGWNTAVSGWYTQVNTWQGQVSADKATVATDKAATLTALAGAQQAQQLAQAAAGGQAGVGIAALNKSLVMDATVVANVVYDTSRDSDGGAWRLRCGHTSWAQEAPSATRGARREFPPEALLVARQASLTIYDALDRDAATGVPRVWMVFVCSGSWSAGNILQTGPIKSAFMLEHRLYVTLANNLHVIDFVDDSCYVFNIFATYGGRYLGSIAARNGACGFQHQGASGSLPTLVGAPASVHARVLPGAPLDHMGLPIPTVAVACGSAGLSVILPNGRVADVGTNSAFFCLLLGGRVCWGESATYVYVAEVPHTDAASANAVAQETYTRSDWAPLSVGGLRYSGTAQGAAVAAAEVAGTLALGSSHTGLALIARDAANPSNGMVAHITTGYATGWMPGDTRLATLCDATTGSITGSGELVANGDFATNTNGWTAANGATLSVESARLKVAGGTTDYPSAYQAIPTVAGQTYVVRADYERGGFANVFVILGSTLGASDLINGVLSATSGTFVSQFTAAGSTSYLLVQGHTADNAVCYFDNISVKLAVPDRSAKAKGLVVNGTLQRNAVATGADVVTYSGFNTSNYLEQPYSADLDTAAGDLAVAVWVNGAATVQRGYYTAGALSGAQWRLINTGTGVLRFSVGDGSATNQAQLSQTIAAGSWRFAIGVIRRATSTIELWLDGVLVASASLTAGSLTNTSATLRVGTEHNGSVYGDGMALLRVAAYAPTPEQIRRMHRDEAPLFQAGAKAFLGGASNAVSSLAADDARGLLAVGTGDGVSLYSGLRRVAYLDGTALGSTIGSDTITSVGAGAGYVLAGTAANAGVYHPGAAYQDEMAARPVPGGPALAWEGVTTDATPIVVGRIHIAEGESLQVAVDVQAIDYAAAQTEGASYTLRARVRRPYGGNAALVGNVFSITVDETTATMDAALAVNTTTHTLDITVTGKAATRLRWRAAAVVNRLGAI